MNNALLQRRGAPGGVLQLTLNRPEQRNALNGELVAALRAALAEAETAGDVRVIVLRGAGGHFCAGGDVKDMAGDAASIRAASIAFGQLCRALADTPLATVAVLEGTVMGGGVGLACAVDVALAGPTASFRLPETSLGLVPAQIAPFLLQRLGHSQARRLAVTGGRLDAAQALAIGLVHEVHDDVDAALARVLGEIRACAPRALAATKALMNEGTDIEAAADVFATALAGDEAAEGIAAFVQRRAPKWAAA